MAERNERSGAAWGALFMRLVLGLTLMAHGLLRLTPSYAEKAGDLLFTKDVIGAKASLVFLGAGEIFVGTLLVIGLFVRLALVPVVVYFTAVGVHKVRAGEAIITPDGSSAEVYLLLLCLAFGILLLGPGKYSLSSVFSDSES